MHVLSLESRPILIIKQCFAPLTGFRPCCSAHLFGVTSLLVRFPRCAALSTRCSHSKGKITANINMASYISGWNKPAFLTALTVTCGAKQIPKSLSDRPHVDLCCLSKAHTHILIKEHAPRHRSPQRGQAGKEVLGWAAVRSSRNIRMFPLQQSAGIRSKLTDR